MGEYMGEHKGEYMSEYKGEYMCWAHASGT